MRTLALTDPKASVDRERVGRIGLFAQLQEVAVTVFGGVGGADRLPGASQAVIHRREIAKAGGVGEERVRGLAAAIQTAIPFFLCLCRLARRGECFREQDVTRPR